MVSGGVDLYDLPSVATQRRATERFRKRSLQTTTSPTITAEQLQRARKEAAAAERRRVGEVLASLTAAGAIDGLGRLTPDYPATESTPLILESAPLSVRS